MLRDLFARDRRAASDFAYVASPLKRARETMEILRTTLGLDPPAYAIDDRLMEISYGEWEGLTLPEIEARDAGHAGASANATNGILRRPAAKAIANSRAASANGMRR